MNADEPHGLTFSEIIEPGATSTNHDMPNGCFCGGNAVRGIVVAGLEVRTRA
jgi:hypothetical protein